jgi:hypothetical protein
MSGPNAVSRRNAERNLDCLLEALEHNALVAPFLQGRPFYAVWTNSELLTDPQVDDPTISLRRVSATIVDTQGPAGSAATSGLIDDDQACVGSSGSCAAQDAVSAV